MAFGFNSNGFTMKRMPDIFASIFANLQASLGNITTSPQSIIGITVTSVASAIADVWEAVSLIVNNFFPRTAIGVNLDYAVERIGISRMSATQSMVEALISGLPGIFIKAGFQASTAVTKNIFQTLTDFTLNALYVRGAIFIVTEAADGNQYQIIINGVVCADYTALPLFDTIPEIITALSAMLTSSTTAQALGCVFTPNLNDMNISMACPADVSVAVGQHLAITSVTNMMPMTAVQYGALTAPIGTLSTIVTPVSGVFFVNNMLEGQPGIATESDDALRIRYFQSLRLAGKSTIDGMRAYLLQNLVGVSQVVVHENVGYGTDPMVHNPPNTLAIIIVGDADNDAVAAQIMNCKPGGIGCWADTSLSSSQYGTAVDSSGENHTIWFSRQSSLYLWLKINVWGNPDETFPNNYVQQIYSSLLTTIQAQTLGKDVILQRYASPIINIQGIGRCLVQGALSTDPTIKPDDATYIPAYPGTSGEAVNLTVPANMVVVFADNNALGTYVQIVKN